MSDQIHDKQYAHRVAGMKRNSGRFLCNGTSDPTEVYGQGFEVTYAGSNKYLVTFDGAYRNLIAAHAGAVGSSSALLAPITDIVDGVYDDASIKVTVMSQDPDTGLFAASLPASNEGVWVHFSVDFLDIGGR